MIIAVSVNVNVFLLQTQQKTLWLTRSPRSWLRPQRVSFQNMQQTALFPFIPIRSCSWDHWFPHTVRLLVSIFSSSVYQWKHQRVDHCHIIIPFSRTVNRRSPPQIKTTFPISLAASWTPPPLTNPVHPTVKLKHANTHLEDSGLIKWVHLHP